VSGTTAAPRVNARPWEDLSSTGLLWLVNRVVFHPRGFALTLVKQHGKVVGWNLQDDGTEVWRFTDDKDDQHFAEAQRTLAAPPINRGAS
jgi:hypothetical protein